MAGERKLTVILAGDSRSMVTELGKAETATGKFGSKIGKLGTTAKVALAGAGVALVKFADSSIDAFVEAEKAQVALEAAYEKFPKLAQGNIEALRDLNSELARKTRFDDDATASAQAVLAQFDLTEKQIRDMTPLLQDYAAKTGKDLPDAAKSLGMAIMGQGRAMKAIGIDFKDTGSAAGNFEQVMEGLREQVGGFAEKEGTTAAGKAQILENQFGELQETVGSVLVPALLRLTTFISTEVVPRFESAEEWLRKNDGAAKVLAITVGGALTAAMGAYAVSAGAAAAATIAATWPVWLTVGAVAALTLGTQKLIDKFDLMPKASKVINAAIGGVAGAVGFLIGMLEKALRLIDRILNFSPTSILPFGGGLDEDTILRAVRPDERALGGPVQAGRSYLVGERGPELLTMGGNGFVTPNHALGGGEVHLHVTQLPGEDVITTGMRELRRFSLLAGG